VDGRKEATISAFATYARRRRAEMSRLTWLAAAAVLLAILAAGLRAATAAGPASARPAAAHAAAVNPWGRAMFGISTDGPMQTERLSTLFRDLRDDAATGAKWLRVDINWAQIQARGARHYNWTRIDRVVTRAHALGMYVLGVLIYTPRWAEARSSCRQADCAPDPRKFAAFAHTAAAHYGRLGVAAYEVWSEENSTAQWLPRPSAAAYTRLLRLAYPAIKSAQHNAIVVTGGTSPAASDGVNYSPQDFLAALYRHGARPYFDAVGAHPYCWPAYPGQAYAWSSWYRMYGAKHSMRSIMVAHGDAAKPIWGTEFGAATYGLRGTYVSPRSQARMIYAGYRLWSTYRWAGPLILFEGRDELDMRRGRTMWSYLGLRYHNFRPKPALRAYRTAVAAF
jgi:hypothetical protein